MDNFDTVLKLLVSLEKTLIRHQAKRPAFLCIVMLLIYIVFMFLYKLIGAAKTVKLKDEITFLADYLELEKLRRHRFNYAIKAGEIQDWIIQR